MIDTRAAADHRAIDGHALAGANAHEVADFHVLDRHLDLLRPTDETRGLGLEINETLDRLGASRLHDEREPLREDVVGTDHHRDGEERGRRIAGPIEHKADDAAGHAREGTDFEQHMLIEDAPPQRLEGHVKNVPPDAEHQGDCQCACEPWRDIGQIALQVEIEQGERHHGKAAGSTDGGPQPA